MENSRSDLLGEVADYYSTKLAIHGESPGGVDWNGEDGQNLRFAQLSKVINFDQAFTINDLGCGYGALFDYLKGKGARFQYLGVDVSADMIQAASLRYQDTSEASFECAHEPSKVADFSVASGIFNVRLQRNDDEWLDYMKAMIDVLDKSSARGFAFNCLTSYSDADKMRPYLYYANPQALFDLCKTKYSRNVALLHDYDLYEFTIIVRKSP
jgi:SAM-dependent methyltransferase